MLGDPGLPRPRPCARPDAALSPTHRHGHGLRAHEVFIDLIALRLLVLHAVVQVLILLHRVAEGCGVSQGARSSQARDPSGPTQIKLVSPQIDRAEPCPLRPHLPGQGHVPSDP